MSKLLDSKSEPATKSELELFQLPPTQVALKEGNWSIIRPSNPITDSGPYTFVIPRDMQRLDFNRNFLYMKIKIVKDDGRNLEVTDDVDPINLLGKTFFKQVTVKLSDKEIYNSGSLYAYRAYIETLLNISQPAKGSRLEKEGFKKDKAGEFDTNTNTSATDRGTRYGLSKEVELIAPVHCDFFMQPRPLIENCQLEMQLHRNSDNFCLMSWTNSYKIKVIDLRWWVWRFSVQDSLGLATERIMLQHGQLAQYPIRKVKVINRHINMGTQSLNENSVFTGQLPRRVVFGLVSSSAFNGNLNQSPLNFQHFGLEEVSLWVGDKQYPSQPIKMDFDENQYMVPYALMFESLSNKTDFSNDITLEDYKGGNCFFVFNLTPDHSDDGTLQLIQEGTVSIDLKFKTPITETQGVELIVYGEFDNLITIDWNRNVFF